jgi:TRAP-type C4-dicarboxylate transport system permease small subunit
LDTYIRAVRWLSRVAGVVAAFLIALAVVVICEMVIERYGLNRTTIWQIDVVTYSIIAATFVGSPYVLLHRGHVNVDILPLNLGPRGRYWLNLFTITLSLAFCVVLLIVTSQYWHEAWAGNWKSDTVWRARMWIPLASMPIGIGLLVLQYVAELLSVATHRQPPFGISAERHA